MRSSKSRSYFVWSIFFIFLLFPLFVLHQILERLHVTLPSRRPDIVLITIDTCRKDALGCYGESSSRSPTIDRFSRSNIQFLDCIAQCPTTAPSHATILSGKDPAFHGIFSNGMPINGSVQLVPEFFSRKGYLTAAFISGYSLIDRVTGLGRGFAVYDDEWSTRTVERSGYDTTRAAIQWLRESDPGVPCFVWLHLFDPHSPYEPPESFRRTSLGSSSGLGMESHQAAYEKNAQAALGAGDFNVLVKDPTSLTATAMEIHMNWTNYLEEIATVDRCIERFMVAFRCTGREKPLVVLTSDHGEGFEKNYFFGHGDRLWESAVAIPMIVQSQDRRSKPKLVNRLAHHIDVLPTLLEECKMNIEDDECQGINLLEMARSDQMRPEPFLFCSAPPLPRKKLSKGLMHAVYDSRFKMIFTVDQSDYSLFDLQSDPEETKNAQFDYPQIYKGLIHALNRRSENLSYPRDARFPDNLSSRETKQLQTLGYLDPDNEKKTR